jgi:hypothetical protein
MTSESLVDLGTQVTIGAFKSHFDQKGVAFVELVRRAVAKGGGSIRVAFTKHPLYKLVKLATSEVREQRECWRVISCERHHCWAQFTVRFSST